jgi:hypothetical protein
LEAKTGSWRPTTPKLEATTNKLSTTLKRGRGEKWRQSSGAFRVIPRPELYIDAFKFQDSFSRLFLENIIDHTSTEAGERGRPGSVGTAGIKTLASQVRLGDYNSDKEQRPYKPEVKADDWQKAQ